MSRLLRQGSGQAYAEVIGDPIAHSKSPLIHNFWLEKLGIDAEYRACHVRAEELADYFARRRGDADWRGCNVTIPHKQAVGRHLDGMEDKAKAIGAVNTVHRVEGVGLSGTNTDVDGVAEAIAGLDLNGREVTVIGAGGAARAAFALLSRSNCTSVHVLARNPEKAAIAANECGLDVVGHVFAPDTSALRESILLINATQLGMSGQERMPSFILSQLDELAEGALVFDMVYAPLETELLVAARRNGIRTSDGLAMLIGQAATAFEKFFGRPTPREHDAELRALLTA
jgi:shikimate dehydrogenase